MGGTQSCVCNLISLRQAADPRFVISVLTLSHVVRDGPILIRVWHVELSPVGGRVARISFLLISVAFWPSISSCVFIYRSRCFFGPLYEIPVSLVESAVLFS